ncbi:MAG TPA: TIGR03619 family F420-dependent LLM class oxidoreductase [Acidimicrobiales bacterium]
MLLGVGAPVSGSWATAENCGEIAGMAEDLGYHSLWTFQRLLSPVDADDRPVLDPQYRSVLDPVATLGYLAAVTDRVRLGVAVLNLPFLSPIVAANQLGTLDVLSGGRLDCGFGTGWMPEEFEAVGAEIAGRGRRADEFVAALRALWGDSPVEHRGALYSVPRSLVLPRPVQRPCPPILLGGTSEPALRRAGRLADGWISSSRVDPADIGTSIAVIRRAAEDADRDPAALRIICRGVVKVTTGERQPLVGSLDDVRGDIAELGDAGVDEVFVDLNFDPAVGSPDADPVASMAYAREVLTGLAPAPRD